MPLMNTPFRPGHCMEAIEGMKAGPTRDIALAEYHYFSGQAEKAMQETEVYLTAADSGIRLSACWIFAYSCLTMGRIDHARYALDEIKSTLAADGQTASPVRAMEAFVAFGAAVLLHLPLPEEMPPAEDFLPLLPPGVPADRHILPDIHNPALFFPGQPGFPDLLPEPFLLYQNTG